MASTALKLKRYLGKKGVYEKEWDSSAKEKFTYGVDGTINDNVNCVNTDES